MTYNSKTINYEQQGTKGVLINNQTTRRDTDKQSISSLSSCHLPIQIIKC